MADVVVGATAVVSAPLAGTVKVNAPVEPVVRRRFAYDVQLCVEPRPAIAVVDMEVEHADEM